MWKDTCVAVGITLLEGYKRMFCVVLIPDIIRY